MIWALKRYPIVLWDRLLQNQQYFEDRSHEWNPATDALRWIDTIHRQNILIFLYKNYFSAKKNKKNIFSFKIPVCFMTVFSLKKFSLSATKSLQMDEMKNEIFYRQLKTSTPKQRTGTLKTQNN